MKFFLIFPVFWQKLTNIPVDGGAFPNKLKLSPMGSLWYTDGETTDFETTDFESKDFESTEFDNVDFESTEFESKRLPKNMIP